MNKLRSTIALAAASGLAFTAPAQAETIKIAYPNWAEGIAMTHLAAAVIEEYLDADVELTMSDPGAIYASLSIGDQDVMLDAWLPNTHEDYWAKYGDQLEDLGPNFGYGVTGLVVPSYVDIDSIEELNDMADELDGKIIGIGTGSGIYRNTQKAIDDYGLDLSQVASSGPVMVAQLKAAVDAKKPIVITGWKPHYMFGRFDLKVLKDPQGIYPIDAVKTVAREDFRKDHPRVAQFLTNFVMTEAHLLELMLAIDESDADAGDVAGDWMEQNEPLVQSWLPPEMD